MTRAARSRRRPQEMPRSSIEPLSCLGAQGQIGQAAQHQDAAGAAKQDAVLRLVSSTLTENVEKSLHRIVSGSIEKEVLPAITNTTTKSVEKKLGEALPQQLSSHVHAHMQRH